MPRLAYKKKISFGEAISSVCFFGLGIVWLSKGLDFFATGEKLRASGLFLCAFISFAASVRFTIQNTLYKLLLDSKENENKK
tara:strand:- start:56 stop:301 length:246 start_codon:yes stop_codon:yes gene_type:complete